MISILGRATLMMESWWSSRTARLKNNLTGTVAITSSRTVNESPAKKRPTFECRISHCLSLVSLLYDPGC
ncbi:hypothetical protein B0H12DRAFT_1138072 [Mycena haematopus]|nr:hypothetical protein B0H12DRAFT_1138072 [Mycena haematopus]